MASLTAGEKLRTARTNGIAASAARCRVTGDVVFFLDPRQREQIAPHLPCLFDLFSVGRDEKRYRQ